MHDKAAVVDTLTVALKITMVDSGPGLCVYIHFSLVFRQVHNIIGVVTSFTGTYRADEWSLVLSFGNGTNEVNIYCLL